MTLVHILPDWIPDAAAVFDCGGFLYVKWVHQGRVHVCRIEALQDDQVEAKFFLEGFAPDIPPIAEAVATGSKK